MNEKNKNYDDMSEVLNQKEHNEILRNQIIPIMFWNKKPVEEKSKIIIVGGQAGAGKSRLMDLKYQEENANIVRVDFDQLRTFHPRANELSKKYPETYHKYTHPDTEKWKNEILKFSREYKYNVLYEGAMRNKEGFLEIANDFKNKGYDVNVAVLAVDKYTSFMAAYERFLKQCEYNNKDENKIVLPSRWVEKNILETQYEGVLKTIQAFEDEGVLDKLEIYVRGENLPNKVYEKNKGEKSNKKISEIIENIRVQGEDKAMEYYKTVFVPEKLPKLKKFCTEKQLLEIEDFQKECESKILEINENSRKIEYEER